MPFLLDSFAYDESYSYCTALVKSPGYEGDSGRLGDGN